MHHASAKCGGFACRAPTRLPREPSPGRAAFLRHSIAQTKYTGIGISTDFPSPTAFALSLGPALPWEDNPGPGNLRFSAEKILTFLYATYADIRTSDTSRVPRGAPSQAYRTLPYHSSKAEVRRFGAQL